MRNAEEYKKLLEQIAELEKDSVNYFDVEKEFFLIDSDNLHTIQTRLYGYSIQRDGIYENDDLTPEAVAGLDGRGCYVYVEVKNDEISQAHPKFSYEAADNLSQEEIEEINKRGSRAYTKVKSGQITIKQDFNGCWGIYLFRHGDYFAISNSFFRLLDHVKFKYPLTVNHDCFHSMLNTPVRPYSETAINEIQIVERNAIVHIDINKKNLELEFIDYREHTIPLDTEEGIATLDRWVEFWSSVYRGIAQHTEFIAIDLSGGFDSRASFLIALHSGIDLNKIKINSRKGIVHTYGDDYDIATQIAGHYGLKLNQPLSEGKVLNYSLSDVFNINLYSRQTFIEIPSNSSQKFVNKFYHISGAGGEAIRTYWQNVPKKFTENFAYRTKIFSNNLSNEMSCSIERLLESAFRAVRDKYNIKDSDSIDIPQYVYIETLCRYHCGKGMMTPYFFNEILFSPLIDPDLWTLQLNTAEHSSQQLLSALLFSRYEPDLLKFRFDSNRSIAPETIAYAQKLNERFPRRLTTDKINDGGGGILSAAA